MENIKIIQADCTNYVKTIKDNSVDLIVTDPPYGIAYRKSGQPYMIGDSANVLGLILPELYRILKDDGAIYIFTSFKMLADWLYRFQMHFKMNNLIIWDKMRNSGLQMGQNYGFSYEMIFYGSKGLHKLNSYKDDVLSFKRKNFKGHPTRKPRELIDEFIKMSSSEGDLIYDPFMGSGTTGESCKLLNRNFIGNELNGNYFKLAENRINAT
jgi:site-specific DNA-methyltransferase (adenine-specific)